MIQPEIKTLEENYHKVKTIYKADASPTSVFLYEDPSTKDKVILKQLDKKLIFSTYQLNSARRELEIHSALKHKNIVKLFDCAENDHEFLILMEYISRHDYFCERIETVKNIQNNKPFNIKPDGNIEKLRSFSFDILRGIEYMHSCGIVHMDIKPANLMVKTNVDENEYPLVKIADFGLSRVVGSDGLCFVEKRCGTDKYIAPEVRDGARVGVNVDMWAYGLVLHLLTVGYLPFALKWTPGQNLRFLPRHWKSYEKLGLTELISECLKVNPDDRISSSRALMHEWFSCGV